ncbi:hypothetical protein [Flammeovirga pacifica]|nr:hypothetical protein [Flammeovirga pacifica]
MKVLNLYHIVELRVLNFLIQSAGIYLALNELQRRQSKEYGYINGFIEGIIVTMSGALPFALFMMIYLTSIEPEFMLYLQKFALNGAYLNPVTILIGLVFEAVGSGVLISYVIMRYTLINQSIKVRS